MSASLRCNRSGVSCIKVLGCGGGYGLYAFISIFPRECPELQKKKSKETGGLTNYLLVKQECQPLPKSACVRSDVFPFNNHSPDLSVIIQQWK